MKFAGKRCGKTALAEDVIRSGVPHLGTGLQMDRFLENPIKLGAEGVKCTQTRASISQAKRTESKIRFRYFISFL